MILRILATIAILALLGANWMLPTTSIGRRGTETLVRADAESELAIGGVLPAVDLVALDGRHVTREDLLGHRVLLTFERSVDW